MTRHTGRCHCGRVRFTVLASPDLTAYECNCSICRMTAYLHLIVRRPDFELECGSEELTTYTFNTHVAQHYFCSRCGIKSFYVPRSNPEGLSINVRCLDTATIASLTVKNFDGDNWEGHADDLRNLTA